jgi:predicted permease
MRRISSILQDVRYGLRQMRRSPGFTATVIGVLALGIGANAAMFTVLDGTLLRKLPYRTPSGLVVLSSFNGQGKYSVSHLADIEQWAQRSRTLTGIAYHENMDAILTEGQEEQEVRKVKNSANLFGVLGVTPAMGRTFTKEEQQPGRDGVVVLSDTVWRNEFHEDQSVLGKVVRIDDLPMMVIGVMPAGFAFPADSAKPQVWTPWELTAKSMTRAWDSESGLVVARRRQEASIAMVQKELSGIQEPLAKLYESNAGLIGQKARVQAVDYRQGLNQEQRTALLALLAAVAVVWLISCANVANLMLARSMARQREIAVRGALGAGRWRLVQQLMVESLLLSVMGAIAGVAFAQIMLRMLRHALVTNLSQPIATHPDARVLIALLGLSIASATAFGVVPAMIAKRMPLDQALRLDGAGTGKARAQHRLQRTLVVVEIALSLSLLVACGLLLRTVFALRHVPLGFRTDHVYVIEPKLPRSKYRSLDANPTVYKPLLERVQRMHGVVAAAVTTVVPLSKDYGIESVFEVNYWNKSPSDKKSQQILLTMKATGPDLQKVLGFRMAQGRYFNANDTQDSQPVIVVNKAFAKQYEQLGIPVTRFQLGGGKNRSFKVIGVVDDLHQVGISDPSQPEVDINVVQMRPEDGFYKPTIGSYSQLAIRTTEDVPGFLQDLQRVMREVNPDLAASNVQTMDQIVEDSMGSQLLAAHLLETLGGLALLVALAGLYSLLAYLVTLRTRELGLRMALGAERGHILGLVMGQAGWLLGVGVAAGVVLSLATMHLLKHFLFGVKTQDGITIASAALLMMMVGLIAAYLPARRASRIEPMEALRTE